MFTFYAIGISVQHTHFLMFVTVVHIFFALNSHLWSGARLKMPSRDDTLHRLYSFLILIFEEKLSQKAWRPRYCYDSKNLLYHSVGIFCRIQLLWILVSYFCTSSSDILSFLRFNVWHNNLELEKWFSYSSFVVGIMFYLCSSESPKCLFGD